MTSKEIARKRKELDNEFQISANLITGKLTEARKEYKEKLEVLQKECSHMWDNGEDAKEKLSTMSICTICRKKFY